jgi:hypothetical protein
MTNIEKRSRWRFFTTPYKFISAVLALIGAITGFQYWPSVVIEPEANFGSSSIPKNVFRLSSGLTPVYDVVMDCTFSTRGMMNITTAFITELPGGATTGQFIKKLSHSNPVTSSCGGEHINDLSPDPNAVLDVFLLYHWPLFGKEAFTMKRFLVEKSSTSATGSSLRPIAPPEDQTKYLQMARDRYQGFIKLLRKP